MKKNVATSNSNLKSLLVAGCKEDIAYNNCKIMIGKFDEIGIKYVYSEYPAVIPGRNNKAAFTILHRYYLSRIV
jgi:hypothetical protein